MSQTTEVIEEIRSFLRARAPRMLTGYAAYDAATPAQLHAFEAELGRALPDDVRDFLLTCDFRLPINGGFSSLPLTELESNRAMMNTLLADGTFDGWFEARELLGANYGFAEELLTPCWWNPLWLPFADDGCGNMKCIDLSPGPLGTIGQVVEMEIQDGQGAFATNFKSIAAYLAAHLAFLEAEKFDFCDIDEVIVVDA